MEQAVERIAIPRDILGKHAAIFFLLNEIEQRKARTETLLTSAKPQSKAVVSKNSRAKQPLLLTDEFLFDKTAKDVELPHRRRSGEVAR